MYRLTIILFLSCLWSRVFTQAIPDDRQIQVWLDALSVKKDVRNQNFNKVREEMWGGLPTPPCEAMERLYNGAQKRNTRCQIRVRYLRAGMICEGFPEQKEDLLDALQMAYETEDEWLQYYIHLTLGQNYNGSHEYGLAVMHFRLFFETLDRNNRADLELPAGALYDMTYSLYHTQEYAECIRTGLTALKMLPDSRYQVDTEINEYQQMLQWNTIGLAYQKLQNYDSAFVAFEKAARLAESTGGPFWMGIIKGNIGDVFYSRGQYDSAYTLLQTDYEQSLIAKQYDNAANSLQWIARIDLRNGATAEALRKLHTARALLDSMPQPNYLTNVYYAYTQAYTSLGRADSVNTYLQQYLHLHDSLQAELTKSRTDMLAVQLNNVKQIQTIKSLNRQKDQITSTRNFTIVIVLLLGIVGYLWTLRSRLKMQMRQREALEGKRRAEAETEKAIAQLDVFRQHLLEKNALIEQWQTAQESKESSEEQMKRLSELTHHLILKDEDWTQFKALFDSVYPGFFISLRKTVPDITQAEQRMAALSKLKLTAKEAANLLGVSPNTVYTTRRRLRQRLGLENDSDLDGYFE